MSSSFENARDDPLSIAMRPPPDETPEQRTKRVKEEREALRISVEIDEQLDRERQERRKARTEIKVLLLGPSGSGKSTTLKNLKLAFTPKALQAEAAQYTVLIYLNVVTTLRLLCDVLAEEEANFSDRTLLDHCAQLKPLLDLEPELTAQLSEASSIDNSKSNTSRSLYEITVPVWSLGKLRGQSKPSMEVLERMGVTERARQCLVDHRETVEYIVEHASTQAIFKARNRRLSHLPGYFLDDLPRITEPNYAPTDDDILRTRIRTIGVSETRFKVESGVDKGVTWIIYDVGGARNQRAAWVPYFDDVNTIIFVAPIGHFDQYLEEEPSINCLKDTLELWDNIVSNKLLSRTEIILFLNKYDILKQKLDLGVRFSKFVTSYRDKNTVESVGKYLQKKFVAIHAQRSPRQGRSLRSHFTSVTDKSSTAVLIAQCRELVLQQHFQQMSLI